EVERRILEFLKPLVAERIAPLAGNTVHQDRRFMARYMPAFDAYLHYRIVDVSTLKELARRWRPDVLATVAKEGRHEALADVHESAAIASISTALWNAMASSVARARCARLVPRVMPVMVPRACGSQ